MTPITPLFAYTASVIFLILGLIVAASTGHQWFSAHVAMMYLWPGVVVALTLFFFSGAWFYFARSDEL